MVNVFPSLLTLIFALVELMHSVGHSLTQPLMHPLTHKLMYSYSQFLPPFLTYSCIYKSTPSFTLTFSLPHSPIQTHSIISSISPSLILKSTPSFINSLPYSLPHSPTHSFPPSLLFAHPGNSPTGALTDCYDELGTRYQLPVYCLSFPLNILPRSPDKEGHPEAGVWIPRCSIPYCFTLFSFPFFCSSHLFLLLYPSFYPTCLFIHQHPYK